VRTECTRLAHLKTSFRAFVHLYDAHPTCNERYTWDGERF